jgi:tartronate-semialdehyde synthase
VPGPQEDIQYLRKTHFDNVPMKPQRVYQCMNNAFDKDTCYVSTIGLSQIAGAPVPARVQAAPLDQLRPGRPAGLDLPAALGVRVADPSARSWRCRATTTSSS